MSDKEPEFQIYLHSTDEIDFAKVLGEGPYEGNFGDQVFGTGPQAGDLGDISSFIDDIKIVDFSWLEFPDTYVPKYSVFPALKELEDEWLKTDTPFGRFKLINNNEPIAVQIKKNKLWDHSEITDSNLYKWAPPTGRSSLPIAKTAMISSEQFYKRLLHRGYYGEVFEVEAKKYMDSENWVKSASLRESILSTHEGLMGNVYVDVTSFDSCESANKFSSKFNKTAEFVLETPFCGGCSYNLNNKCSLLMKKIASKDPLDDKTSKKYLDYLSTVNRIDTDFKNKTASLSLKEKVRAAFKYKKTVLPRKGGVKATAAPNLSRPTRDDTPFIKIASKYLQKGLDVNLLRERFTRKMDGNRFTSVINAALKELPIVPTSIDECDSITLKEASLLTRSKKCGGCVSDMGTHCRVAGTQFDKNIIQSKVVRQGGVFAEPAPKTKVISKDLNNYVPKVASALKTGVSYGRILKASQGKLTLPEFDKVLSEAVRFLKVGSPDLFNTCTSPQFSEINLIRKGSKCGGCNYNGEELCGQLKNHIKAAKQVDEIELIKDHNIYNSFYKDLGVTKFLEINTQKPFESLKVDGLNEFNI